MGGFLASMAAMAVSGTTGGSGDDAQAAEESPIGSLWYELYAVLVHSGGANGGHYYSFVKDMGTGQWGEFNDSKVTIASEARVRSAFGGNSNKPGIGQNAYMLLYRREDAQLNVSSQSVELPATVTRDMDTEREEEKARRKEYPLAVSIKDGQYQRWP